MRVVLFGTYDAARHPRVVVLLEGLVAAGCDVEEINEPLRMSTSDKVQLLRRPWGLAGFVRRLASCWRRLWVRARAAPTPNAVIVGYMGHFDVHLAKRAFPGVPVILDHLISAEGTARDRGIGGKLMQAILRLIDRAAIRRADLVLVDTEEHLTLLPASASARALVVEVGSPGMWFRPVGEPGPGDLTIVFYGLFTPLQGAPVIADAIAQLVDDPIRFTMIGTGQDHAAARRLAAANPKVSWIDWLDPDLLIEEVSSHDVCLGIFGVGDKAGRVVPNKVFQGAAAGCALVTADTAPQRRALGDAALFVPAGDASALAAALRGLAADRHQLARRKVEAYQLASRRFRPQQVVEPLIEALRSTGA